jgi:hypothetical protein
MYGYLIIKLTSMCDKTICTYKTFHHDAKYLFELYSMTLQTFSCCTGVWQSTFVNAEYIIQVMNSAVKDK